MALFESLVLPFSKNPRLLWGFKRSGLRHLRRQVPDSQLRAKLTPNYMFGCKRPTFSNIYYPALSAPNVDVVTRRNRADHTHRQRPSARHHHRTPTARGHPLEFSMPISTGPPPP